MLWEIAGPDHSSYGIEKLGLFALRSAMMMVSRTKDLKELGYLLRTIADYFEVLQERCKHKNPQKLTFDGMPSNLVHLQQIR